MPNERKCTQCGNNGHNTRTCTGCKKFMLFGVQINVAADGIRKSKSMGHIEDVNAGSDEAAADGYTSDGVLHKSPASLRERFERKKGTPWTEDEHRYFLEGLEKLGKGDWKGISKYYVPTRNSSQVASHAQKYFLRLASQEKKHRRASVFDIPLNKENQPPQDGTTSAFIPVEKPKPVEKENNQGGGNLTVANNIGELQAQQDFRAPVATFERQSAVATFERPPPPMTIWSASDLSYMAYLRDLYAQGFVSTRPVQVSYPVSYVPAPNFQPPVTTLQPGSSSQANAANYKNIFVSGILPYSFAESSGTELQHGWAQAGSASQV